MVESKDQGVPEVVKDLAEAFSAQARLSNRIWLTLIVVAIVVFPVPQIEDHSNQRDLPFGLGTTSTTWFDVVGFAMLVVLLVAYCQAQAQAVRADRFAHAEINKLKENESSQTTSNRYFYDFLVTPSLTRVAPLPLLLNDFVPFVGDSVKRRFSSGYYFILQILSALIRFGVPICALWIAHRRLSSNLDIPGWGHAIFSSIGFVAIFAALEVAAVEIYQAFMRARKFLTGEI